MKTIHKTLPILFALSLSSIGLQAQKKADPIYISAPKFAQPLVESWITEFSKTHPESNLQLQSNTNGEAPQLNIVVDPTSASLSSEENNKTFYTARYALLPVTNSRNTLLAQLGKKRFDKKAIDKLFFEPSIDEEVEEGEPEVKPTFKVTVYSAENAVRFSSIVASYYGREVSDLKGKKVLGDEIHLISALKKDSTGVSFNNLNYLYDLNSRNLKPELALLPLDVKKEARPQLNGTVDDLIKLLENSRIETIPVGKIGFSFNQPIHTDILKEFLQWTLTDGQRINHQQGFLQADEVDRNLAQRALLSGNLLTLK